MMFHFVMFEGEFLLNEMYLDMRGKTRVICVQFQASPEWKTSQTDTKTSKQAVCSRKDMS